MARSQVRKLVETAFNKGYFSVHHKHQENTIKTINLCALTEMDILITMIEKGVNPEALVQVVKEMRNENYAMGNLNFSQSISNNNKNNN